MLHPLTSRALICCITWSKNSSPSSPIPLSPPKLRQWICFNTSFSKLHLKTHSDFRNTTKFTMRKMSISLQLSLHNNYAFHAKLTIISVSFNFSAKYFIPKDVILQFHRHRLLIWCKTGSNENKPSSLIISLRLRSSSWTCFNNWMWMERVNNTLVDKWTNQNPDSENADSKPQQK